jgi:hypothetical protein
VNDLAKARRAAVGDSEEQSAMAKEKRRNQAKRDEWNRKANDSTAGSDSSEVDPADHSTHKLRKRW